MEHRWKFCVLENGEYVRVPFYSYFMFGKCIFMYLFIYVVLFRSLRYGKQNLHQVHQSVRDADISGSLTVLATLKRLCETRTSLVTELH